jgi:CheY-like chemotaxis protein
VAALFERLEAETRRLGLPFARVGESVRIKLTSQSILVVRPREGGIVAIYGQQTDTRPEMREIDFDFVDDTKLWKQRDKSSPLYDDGSLVEILLSGVIRDRRRGRILVVDDEKAIGIVVHLLLEEEHDVVEFVRAQDALALIRAGARFDVILCDLMMPEMSGVEFYTELSRVEPAQADRVVFMTGAVHRSTAWSFVDRLPNMRIDKPFTEEALIEIIRNALRG